MSKTFIDNLYDFNNYNLSYDFFYNIVGINIQECYPSRNGFCILDDKGNSYLLINVLFEDLDKYNHIFNIIDFLKQNNINILGMYSLNNKKYFFDDINNRYYVIFKLANGIYNKWINFDLCSVENVLKNFYDGSKNILKYLYSSDMIKNSKLLTIGSELKLVDKYFMDIENIEKIISYKQSRSSVDNIFLENKQYIQSELNEIKEFFLSREYRDYCENHENIRFINGELSNKSFLFNGIDCFIVNFYNSSIDLFVKDIAILIERSLLYIDNIKLSLFIKSFLKKFNENKDFHLKVIINYIKMYNYIFKWFNEYYLQSESYKNVVIESKINEINYYKQKQNDFMKYISSI